MDITKLTHRIAISAGALALALSGTASAQSSPSGPPAGGPPAGGPPSVSAPPPEGSAPAAQGAPACTIKGTKRADVLRGTGGDDVICGLGGNDRIKGMGGDDVLRGGPGKDVLDGGAGIDSAVKQKGDRLKSIENADAPGLKARMSSASYQLGQATCSTWTGQTSIIQSAPSATSDTVGWVEHWNALAVWDGQKWAVDANTWVGPYYNRTDYPGWFYFKGEWRHQSQAGGETYHDLAAGKYVAPVQWIHFYNEDTTVYAFQPVTQNHQGAPVNEGQGYCTT
jgi:hypothetical protein